MRKLFSIGLVRGILGQIVGTALGIGLLTGIRAAMGLGWKAEPAAVLGAFFGVFGFLIAVGAVSDWWKWAKG